MKKLILIFVSFVLLVFQSCSYFKYKDYSIDNLGKDSEISLNAWIGAHKSELFYSDEWGAPDEIFDNGIDGEIIIYKDEVSNLSFVKRSVGSDDYDIKDKSYTKYWNFYTDNHGIIRKFNYGTK